LIMSLLGLIHVLAIDKYVVIIYFSVDWSVMFMPQRVRCRDCGETLYEGPELRPPDEILHEHDGKCPKCGKKLSFIPIEVNVDPVK
jgi:phage FluMu protein Com